MKQSVIVALTLAYSQAHGFAPAAFVVRPPVVLKYTETPPTSLVDWFGTDEIAHEKEIGSKEDWVAQEFNKAESATQMMKPKQRIGPVEWFAYATQQQLKSPPPRAGTWKGSVPDTHVGVPEWMIQTYGATSNNQVVDTSVQPNVKADWFAVESAEKMPEHMPAGTWKGSVPDTHVGVPDWMIQTYGATRSNQVMGATSKVQPNMKTDWFAVESADKVVQKHTQKLQDVRMDRQVPQWLVKAFGTTGKESTQVQTSDSVDWFATAGPPESVQPVAKQAERSLGKERQELAHWMAHKFTTNQSDKVVKVLPMDSVDWFATASPVCMPQGEVTHTSPHNDALDHADWFDFASSV